MSLVPQAFLKLPQRSGLETDQKRANGLKFAASLVRVRQIWGRCARFGAGAPIQQPTSLSITFDSRIRLLRRFFSMKAMNLLFVLLQRNLHNITLKHIKNIKSLRPDHRFMPKRRLPSETLGLINPLSNSSCICFANSFISSGAIL